MKLSKIFIVGLFIISITLLFERFLDIPDIIYILCFGSGLICEIIGIIRNRKIILNQKKKTN
jgi:hypothetical protein